MLFAAAMSHENEKDKNRIGLLTSGRSSDVDRSIQETTEMLENTRAFLEGLRGSDEKTKEYVKELSETLERDVQRLRARKEEK